MKHAATPPPATDFASAAMMRLLTQGMRELRLTPNLPTALSGARGATVSLDDKRRLVSLAVAQGGVACLALLGRGLHRLADEPTHRALASARDAQDLLMRWGRLERYIHSRHWVEVQALADDGACLAHLPKAGSPPPLPAENLVVLGVVMALLEAIGATDVRAWVGDVPVYPQPDAHALAVAVQQSRTATWSIRWSHLAAPARPPGRDAVQTARVAAPATWPGHAQRGFVTLCQDLSNPLTLPALAITQGEAPRSFQRSLSRAGLSYSQLLGEARCRSASWWLVHTATPVAEVGFVCGYSDQAHFTRDFRQRVGLTPLRYRAEFSVTG